MIKKINTKKVLKYMNIMWGRRYALPNRWLNRNMLNKKVFCIGLHKTGTTSLYEFAVRHGYKAVHNPEWVLNSKLIKKNNFICDGGSHFNDQCEFEYEKLAADYPDAKFILQTRDPLKWIVSKLIHAGWGIDTIVEKDDVNLIQDVLWKRKSYLSVQEMIKHKAVYEKKVIDFFKKTNPGRLLVVDVTDGRKQRPEKVLRCFLGIRSFWNIDIPHRNKARKNVQLSSECMDIINITLAEYKDEFEYVKNEVNQRQNVVEKSKI